MNPHRNDGEDWDDVNELNGVERRDAEPRGRLR